MVNKNWKTEHFKAEEIAKYIDEETFLIPHYQRTNVWDIKKKNDFIDSIKNGYPFGTILIYHNEKENKYQIIDGLQRCSTIRDFINNPAAFFNIEDLTDNIGIKLNHFIGNEKPNEEDIKKVFNEVIDWVKTEHKDFTQATKIQNAKFARWFVKLHPKAEIYFQNEEIEKLMDPIFSNYSDLCRDFLVSDVPAIVLKDGANLATIFVRLNTKGTPLTPYEIYAATWINNKYHITSKKLLGPATESNIVKMNLSRYEDRSLVTADFNSRDFVEKSMLNMFEICYAFGKLLTQRYPELFKRDNGKNKDIPNQIGFVLINSCLGLKYNKIDTLDKNFELSKLDLNLFLEKILECTDIVSDVIGKYNLFKLNSKDGAKNKSKTTILHGDFQIISMISSVFHAKYTSSIYLEDGACEKKIHLQQINKDWNDYLKKFKEYAKIKYVIDILGDNWSGHGNETMDAIVALRESYISEISKERFKRVAYDWYEKSKDSRLEHTAHDVKPPTKQDKLFLTLIYLDKFNAEKAVNGSTYDIEHLATKNLMEKLLSRFPTLKLPISSIGNTCLLPQRENRAKQDRTIYEDTEFLKKSDYTLDELEKSFTFTIKDDFKWTSNDNLSEKELTKEYHTYINTRFERMVEIIINSLYK